ncbi:MAG: YbaN family protein [Gammaproteobacteria bacterium]|nr:YbaN family protein [Gammaproteobacteria bacterium]
MKQQSIRILLIIAGWFFIVLGVIGIFLPLLPTTVFILLAAACFARSSDHFHDWLISHPQFGEILKSYQSGRGIERRVRNRAIAVMWFFMSISMLIIYQVWSTVLLITTGLLVTLYLIRLPVYQPIEKLNAEKEKN